MKSEKIIFVCLGNICRSPAAEGLMNHLLKSEQLTHAFQCDSAGILDYHEGNPPDHRMQLTAQRRGIELTSHSRPFRVEDFESFDFVLPMDENNLRDLHAQSALPHHREKIYPFWHYVHSQKIAGVPDPYYGGPEGFEHCWEILAEGCHHFLQFLRSR